ncbi:MAG: RagB/SusD family nutrient uptake outer membrane protein [Marinifilaceae bacterium]
MRNIINTILSLFLAMTLQGCTEWLNPGSEDRIMEDDLFKTEKGFITALNGVYLDMLDRNLYGGKLTCELSDVLAQLYDCSAENHKYNALWRFNDESKRNFVTSIWSKCYYNLNAINTILENCESRKSILSDRYYHVIKGEAFALRALLHFELLRIFGPIYCLEPHAESIVYMESSNLYLRPLLKASDVAEHILADLECAELCLENMDPIIDDGPLHSSSVNGESNAMRYRTVRMNYYAVLALTARVALYCDLKEKALTYAERVIEEAQIQKKWFHFATRQQVEGNGAEGADRVFQSEILFGLHNVKRSTLYEGIFSNQLSLLTVLRPNEIMLSYYYDDLVNDLRLNQWKILRDGGSVVEEKKSLYFVKYEDVSDNGEGYATLMPIIKLSEMYLIIAECAPSYQKRFAALNAIRSARNINNYDDLYKFDKMVEMEFRREFIGEGQLFWFYKRRNAETINSYREYMQEFTMEKNIIYSLCLRAK